MDPHCSVADPGCLSRIPDPDFYPSRIQKQQQKREATKFNKIVNYFSFEVLMKKIWDNFQTIIELFTKKIVEKLFKICSWDPGSEIRKNPIPDPGSRGQKGTGSRIRIRNTAALVSMLQLCTSMRMRIRGAKTNADPDPDSGQTFPLQKVEFLHEKKYKLFTFHLTSLFERLDFMFIC